ncbi:MAG: hypothetical protein BWY28_00998 [bacterium ADurb.Bin236]|nr:MAG: hypothetical protein BWY28_00998 [bacterium ADurb.Bin236]HOY63128.1 hypothetical protein [bacterium]HPN92988.1 hypothetical protein [bacterium]
MSGSGLTFDGFRAAYVAGGPGCLEFVKNLFAPQNINEPAFSFAGDAARVKALAEANFNFAVYPYFLGQPPESSGAQKDSFAAFAESAAAAGIETIALVVSSSYARRDGFKSAPWAARLPNGKHAMYSRAGRRALSCWVSEEWIETLRVNATEALSAGASGVFMDFPCFGSAPIIIGDALAGAAGCHCPACRAAFRSHLEESGSKPFSIPAKPSLSDDRFAIYSKWRAGVVSSALDSTMCAVKTADPAALFGVVAPHIAHLPSLPLFGLAPAWALSKPNICCVERHSYITFGREGLFYESPGIRALQACSRGTLVASLAYPFGPAPDIPAPSERAAATVAAASACGASALIRAAEYRDDPSSDNIGCSITDPAFADRRDALAAIYNFIDKNADVFEDAAPVARVAVLYSLKAVEAAPSFVQSFFRIYHTLTETQIPVLPIEASRIGDAGALEGVQVVISPSPAALEDAAGLDLASLFNGKRLICSGAIPECVSGADASEIDPTFMDIELSRWERMSKGRAGRALLARLSGEADIFGGFPLSRRAGLPAFPFLCSQSMSALCPPPKNWKILYDAVSNALKAFPPDVVIESPAYIHVQEWKKGTSSIFHIVNLLSDTKLPDQIALRFPVPVSARVIDSDKNKITYVSNETSVYAQPRPYQIIEVKNRY